MVSFALHNTERTHKTKRSPLVFCRAPVKENEKYATTCTAVTVDTILMCHDWQLPVVCKLS